MKKLTGYILLASMLVLQLCGCGRGTGDASTAENLEDDYIGISVEPGSILDPSAASSLAGKDNSVDAYAAAMSSPLRVETPAGALEGGAFDVFLGASKAYCFKKHLFFPAAKCWDEVAFVTADGGTGSASYDRDHQKWAIGPVAGSDNYVTLELEEMEDGETLRYFLAEMDENQEKLREFSLDFLSGDEDEVVFSLLNFAVDQSGTAHLLRYAESGLRYTLVSSEGEILAECALENNAARELVPLYDGRVALLTIANDGKGMSLQHMDVETGKPAALAAWEKLENKPYYATLLDEGTLLYADKEGVYCVKLPGGEPELLYLWRNHGIIAHGVPAIQAGEEGQIRLIYEDSEGYNYLCLQPVTEQVEIRKITMAVRDMEPYQWAVSEFNKRYPGCYIELVEYGYRDTALLTELSAGKGPALIETSLLPDFSGLAKLWEPLDTVMEQLGITEGLLPSVMEMGKINGKLYGMVTNFSLETLVVNDPNLKDWDYDAFIQRVEDSQGLESMFDINYGGHWGDYFIMNFLCHGLEDNYFRDAKTGRMVFDSDKFRKALELANKYGVQNEVILPASSLKEGKVLCNRLSIYKPEQLALYRVYYGENVNYIGYPTSDGGAHFMYASNMLSVRRAATKEEKEVAVAFINLCLSYEGQAQMAKTLNFTLSVRGDVLEEQIASMNEWEPVGVSGFDQIKLGSDLNIELDRKTLLDMIDTAKYVNRFPSELRAIMTEELDAYFSGGITEDMLIKHLESRVGLYVEERK